jgi:signal transduction histidine kinase
VTESTSGGGAVLEGAIGRRARLPEKIALTAAAYVVTGLAGLYFASAPGGIAAVWPASGIGLAAVLLSGYRVWPGIWLGSCLTGGLSLLRAGSDSSTALAVLEVSCAASGATLEALLGAYLYRRVAGQREPLDGAVELVQFLILSGIASCAAGATVGASIFWLAGFIPGASYAEAWWTWWLGDTVGVFVMTPLIFAWKERPKRGFLPEAALVLASIAALGVLTFWPFSPLGRYPVVHLFFTCLIWAALRLGPHGATLGIFMVSALATWRTAAGHGPFAESSPAGSWLLLSVFIANLAVTTLVLVAVVSERARARASLVRTQEELKESIRVRDDFLSIASHELRTPLTSLLLRLQLLERMLAKKEERAAFEARSAEHLAATVVAGRRMSNLIDALLDVSRITQQRIILAREEVDLTALVEEVVKRFQVEAAQARCVVSVEANGRVPGVWDRMRLEQVVVNLLTNAIKYGASKPVTMVVRADGEWAILRVQDRGIGISAEDQGRIFGRFERAVPVHHYGGFGLGLWITRQIVEECGGRITVESQPDDGSTFTVELPCTASSASTR